MTRKSNLLNGASPAAVQFAGRYRRAVTKPAPVGALTVPIREAGPVVYRIED